MLYVVHPPQSTHERQSLPPLPNPLQVVRREVSPSRPPLGLPWPVRPEALVAPAAAALLLLGGSGPLGGQLHLTLSSGSSSLDALEQQQPRSAADAHLLAQRTWRQRQQLASAPSLAETAALPSTLPSGMAASSMAKQQLQDAPLSLPQQQDAAQPPPPPQRSSGADRPLVFDRQTSGALAACMVVSWPLSYVPAACTAWDARLLP